MINYVDLMGKLACGTGKPYPARKDRHVKRVVIHHTAVVAPVGMRGEQRQIRSINRGHIARGWPGIGYHTLIGPSGTIYRVNSYRIVTNHVGGFNRSSIGVALMGELHKHRPTEQQLAALTDLLGRITKRFGPLDVVGHNDLNPDTICPGNWLVEDIVSHDKTYFGYHLADNGNITQQAYDNIRNVNAITVLLHLDRDAQPTNYYRIASYLPEDSIVTVRLYMSANTRWNPDEFFSRTMERIDLPLSAFYNRRVIFQVHNEPNHFTGLEGWGKTAEDAKDFAKWYAKTTALFRNAGIWNLAFPGLALGEGTHGERTWAEICAPEISSSKFLAVHCYWTDEAHLNDINYGGNYKWYLSVFPHMDILCTEVAHSGVDIGKAPDAQTQAAHYARWMQLANKRILAATFFMMGGSPQWHGFNIYQTTAHKVAKEVKQLC